jgi:hypothetical protein
MAYKYEDIIFLHQDSEESHEALAILEDCGEHETMEFLKQWDYGDCPVEERPDAPRGTDDTNYQEGDYIMSYNTRLGYIGLIKVIK